MRAKSLFLGLLLLLTLSPQRAFPEDEPAAEVDVVRAACEGRISGLLDDLRQGDAAAREVATQEIRARARFAIPYLLAAAESTSDDSWRERCRALAATLESGAPPALWPHRGPLAEYPNLEEGAIDALRELARRTQTSAGPQPDLEVAERLHDAERYGEAIESIRLFATKHPDRLVEALEAARSPRYHEDPAAQAGLFALARLANARAPALDAEGQARVALALAGWYTDTREKALKRMTTAYAGTQAALLAEVRSIGSYSTGAGQEVARYEAFADAHPGTEAARLALEQVAFHLSCTNLTNKYPDPLDRFRRLAAVAVRLQSPEFPGSEGPIAAVRHLNDFFVSSGEMPEASAKGLLDAYRLFFRHHFLLDVLAGEGATVDYHLPAKLERLLAATGVEKALLPAAVQGELAQLELHLPDSAGSQYLGAEREALAGDGRSGEPALERIEAGFPGTLYARKALALRAGLRYRAGDWEGAEKLYARHLEQHPTSAFAWLAALRIGHCRQMREAWSDAIHAYQAASETYGEGNLLLSLLAPVHLARCFEATGQIEEATSAYRRALGMWPTGGAASGVWTTQSGASRATVGERRPDDIVRAGVVRARLSLLERSQAHPDAVQRYVHGETLRAGGDADGALKAWEGLLAQHPGAPIAADARRGVALIWLDRALRAADRTGGSSDEEAALVAAAAADKVGSRFGSFAAALVRAAIALRIDAPSAAQTTMATAIAKWQETQTYTTPRDDLEADVAAVRVAAFQPDSPLYRMSSAKVPHYVLCSTLETVHADGSRGAMEVAPRLERYPTALYFTREELALLERYVEELGDEEGAGSAEPIAEMLGAFFPVCPGHWGGWHLDSFPSFSAIHFADEVRTSAIVKFRVGYEGGDATVERVNGGWKLTDVSYRWIE